MIVRPRAAASEGSLVDLAPLGAAGAGRGPACRCGAGSAVPVPVPVTPSRWNNAPGHWRRTLLFYLLNAGVESRAPGHASPYASVCCVGLTPASLNVPFAFLRIPMTWSSLASRASIPAAAEPQPGFSKPKPPLGSQGTVLHWGGLGAEAPCSGTAVKGLRCPRGCSPGCSCI